MAFQQSRASFPLTAEGDPYRPVLMQQVDSLGNLAVPDNGLVPQGGTAISGSSGNVANASAVATLAAAASKLNYITGFDVTGAGATAASVVAITVAGLKGGTQTFNLPVPAGVAVGLNPLSIQFCPPYPASAVNTAIVVTVAALGAGNTNCAVNARGIQV